MDKFFNNLGDVIALGLLILMIVVGMSMLGSHKDERGF